MPKVLRIWTLDISMHWKTKVFTSAFENNAHETKTQRKGTEGKDGIDVCNHSSFISLIRDFSLISFKSFEHFFNFIMKLS